MIGFLKIRCAKVQVFLFFQKKSHQFYNLIAKSYWNYKGKCTSFLVSK